MEIMDYVHVSDAIIASVIYCLGLLDVRPEN